MFVVYIRLFAWPATALPGTLRSGIGTGAIFKSLWIMLVLRDDIYAAI
jgi:hypothetical protein